MITKTRSGLKAAGRMTSLVAALLLMFGCEGERGTQGPPGPTGSAGDLGPQGDPGELDPSLSTWEKALAGVGGQEALDNLGAFEVQSSGMRSIAGESYAAWDDAVAVSTFDRTVSWDIAGDALRVDWDRSITFAGGIPLTYSEIINGDVGHVDGVDNFFGFSTMDMPSERWASVTKQEMLLNPQIILQAVAADPGIATEGGAGLHNGAIHELLVVDAPVFPVTLWINATTGRIAKLTTMENDHLHRDVALEVYYHDWMNDAAGGVAFPLSVYLVLNGQLMHEEYRTAINLAPDFDPTLFDFPAGAAPVYDADAAMFGMVSHQFHQAFASLGLPFDAKQDTVVPMMLATGIYFLGGGSHNSLAVEQNGGIVILEPPLYPERSDAILAWVATQFPGKSVTHVVISHHHSDHAAGARSFVAAGATVVLAEPSVAYFRDVFRASSTIWPDALEMNPAPANMMVVPDGGSYLIANGGANNVEVFHIDNVHANDVLIAHVAAGPYVFESDLWNPDDQGGGALNPQAAIDLLNGINDAGINDPALTVVGGHATWGPISDLEAYVNGLP